MNTQTQLDPTELLATIKLGNDTWAKWLWSPASSSTWW